VSLDSEFMFQIVLSAAWVEHGWVPSCGLVSGALVLDGVMVVCCFRYFVLRLCGLTPITLDWNFVLGGFQWLHYDDECVLS
jgi:hypothetical protein